VASVSDQNNIELESTGYSALPSPPRLMRRTHTQRDSVTDERRATQYLLRSLSDGEGNNTRILLLLPHKDFRNYMSILLLNINLGYTKTYLELLQLPVPGYGTVYRHISEMLTYRTVGSGSH